MWTAAAARISNVQLQHLRGMHQQGVHCAFIRDGYATRGTLALSSHHVREGACNGTTIRPLFLFARYFRL
jgi:hypothetical protein